MLRVPFLSYNCLLVHVLPEQSHLLVCYFYKSNIKCWLHISLSCPDLSLQTQTHISNCLLDIFYLDFKPSESIPEFCSFVLIHPFAKVWDLRVILEFSASLLYQISHKVLITLCRKYLLSPSLLPEFLVQAIIFHLEDCRIVVEFWLVSLSPISFFSQVSLHFVI